MHGASLQARLGAVHTVQPVIGGDAKVFCVAAASLVAKVTRDAIMRAADAAWPGYGLAEHKGYGTAAHFAALRRLGASPFHRLTFAPLKTMLPREAEAARGAPLAEPKAAKAAAAKAAAAAAPQPKGKRARKAAVEAEAGAGEEPPAAAKPRKRARGAAEAAR